MHSTPDGSISVIMASKGRPDFVREAIDGLQRQTLKPNQIIVVVPSKRRFAQKTDWGTDVQYIVGPLGLTLQRNRGIALVPNSVRYVGCFDDDFELRADYLEQAVAFMNANAAVVGISGHLVANGGITREEAKELLAKEQTWRKPERPVLQPWKASYPLRLQHDHPAAYPGLRDF